MNFVCECVCAWVYENDFMNMYCIVYVKLKNKTNKNIKKVQNEALLKSHIIREALGEEIQKSNLPILVYDLEHGLTIVRAH